MSNPYFSVGEEVILCSKSMPELNGDQTVEAVFMKGDIVQEVDGVAYENKGSNGYYLIGINRVEIRGVRNLVCESALRKKHKPSTDSFTEMMGNIKELVTQ